MEVLLTLMVAAIFVSVVGSMTLIMNEAQSSTTETRAAQMARQMISDLTAFNAPISTPPSPVTVSSATGSATTGTPSPPTGATVTLPVGAPKGAVVLAITAQGCTTQSVDLTKSASYSAYFDINGSPVTSGDPTCTYAASATVTPSSSRGGLSQVEVQVWPSSMQNVNTHALPWSPAPYRFVTVISLPTTQLSSNP